jgi:hypothetical protein
MWKVAIAFVVMIAGTGLAQAGSNKFQHPNPSRDKDVQKSYEKHQQEKGRERVEQGISQDKGSGSSVDSSSGTTKTPIITDPLQSPTGGYGGPHGITR